MLRSVYLRLRLVQVFILQKNLIRWSMRKERTNLSLFLVYSIYKKYIIQLKTQNHKNLFYLILLNRSPGLIHTLKSIMFRKTPSSPLSIHKDPKMPYEEQIYYQLLQTQFKQNNDTSSTILKFCDAIKIKGIPYVSGLEPYVKELCKTVNKDTQQGSSLNKACKSLASAIEDVCDVKVLKKIPQLTQFVKKYGSRSLNDSWGSNHLSEYHKQLNQFVKNNIDSKISPTERLPKFEDYDAFTKKYLQIQYHLDMAKSIYCKTVQTLGGLKQQILARPVPRNPLCCRPYLYQGQSLCEPGNFNEDNITYQNQLSVKQQSSPVRPLICSLLNKKGGILFFGCRKDPTGKIHMAVGWNCTDSQKQKIKIYLHNVIENFYPKVEYVWADFVPIKQPDDQKYIQGRYILRVKVEPGKQDYLYQYTIYKTVFIYIRNQNGDHQQLTPAEIEPKIKQKIKSAKQQTNNKPKELHAYSKCLPPENGSPVYEQIDNEQETTPGKLKSVATSDQDYKSINQNPAEENILVIFHLSHDNFKILIKKLYDSQIVYIRVDTPDTKGKNTHIIYHRYAFDKFRDIIIKQFMLMKDMNKKPTVIECTQGLLIENVDLYAFRDYIIQRGVSVEIKGNNCLLFTKKYDALYYFFQFKANSCKFQKPSVVKKLMSPA